MNQAENRISGLKDKVEQLYRRSKDMKKKINIGIMGIGEREASQARGNFSQIRKDLSIWILRQGICIWILM